MNEITSFAKGLITGILIDSREMMHLMLAMDTIAVLVWHDADIYFLDEIT